MVGMAVAGFITYKRLFNSLTRMENSVTPLIVTIKMYSRMQILGGSLIIAGGVLMMFALHGVIMQQLWFKVKIALLLLLIFNMPLTFRPANKRLKLFLSHGQSDIRDMIKAKRLLDLFYILQFLIFLTIFILSVFRFN
jgi:hypothetical protein